MKTIKIKEKEVQIKTSWDELSIDEYLRIIDLNNKEVLEEEFIYDLIKTLTGESDDFLSNLYMDEFNELSESINEFNTADKIEPEAFDSIEIDGITFVPIKANKLTVGEMISLKLLKKNNISELENILNMLSILIRPSFEKVDENNQVKLEPQPFTGDMDVLNIRKQMFKSIDAAKALWVVGFFTTGRE